MMIAMKTYETFQGNHVPLQERNVHAREEVAK